MFCNIPYSRSKIHVWQTFLSFAQVWQISITSQIYRKQSFLVQTKLNLVIAKNVLSSNCSIHQMTSSWSIYHTCLFKPSTFTRIPSENSKWSCTNLTFFAVFLFGHANVWVISKTCLTENREILSTRMIIKELMETVYIMLVRSKRRKWHSAPHIKQQHLVAA